MRNRSPRSSRWLLLAPTLLVLGGGTSCAGFPGFFFLEPFFGLLSLADDSTEVSVLTPFFGRLEALEVSLDGAPALALGAGLTLDGRIARGTIEPLPEGRYELDARAVVRIFWIFRVPMRAHTWFERRALDRPDDCELLNGADCLLPYPSSRYLEAADTETGVEVVFPDGVLPMLGGAPLVSDGFGRQDGFSPAAQVLMHFPGGVDPVLSGASHLRPDTRTFDDTSLRPDSPTLLFDVDAGMRQVPHFIEQDARAIAAGQPERSVLFLRPAEGLVPGHRYIVAMRNLKHPDGSDVEAEPVFAALRDWRPTDVPGVREQRRRIGPVLHTLARAGVARRDLVLAFDFVVQSQEDLTGEMLAMRDEAFAWLAEQSDPTFTVFPFFQPGDDPDGDFSFENDCSEPDERNWRQLRGTFRSPLFLSSDPLLQPVVGGRLVDDDGDGLPDAQGTMDANFAINVPCAALDAGDDKIAPILHGHGLFGNFLQASGLANALGGTQVANGGADFVRIAGATDWNGLSSFDFSFANILQPSFILNAVLFDPNNFGTLPDRLRQGVSNAAVLGRMMKEGRFNVDPAFQTPDGEGVFPGPSVPLDYFGVSLGGIMGSQLAAVSPDIARGGMDVPASNFSIMIQRSAAIGLISTALSILNPDPLAQALFFALAEELWDSAEPAGYLRNLTRDPLPGAGPPKDILMTVARYDGIVPNVASDIMARTLGLPNLHDVSEPNGSAVAGRVGVPDVPGPLAEGDPDFVGAVVWHDLGMYDLSNPAVLPFVPPLTNQEAASSCDPHGRSFRTGAAAMQITTFLETGVIENFCDGVCDGLATGGGFAPFELQGGSEPCNPL